jgi:hypothetical protein
VPAIPLVSRRAMSFIATKHVPSMIASLRVAEPANDITARSNTIAQIKLSSFHPLDIRVNLYKTTERTRCLLSSGVTAGV